MGGAVYCGRNGNQRYKLCNAAIKEMNELVMENDDFFNIKMSLQIKLEILI